METTNQTDEDEAMMEEEVIEETIDEEEDESEENVKEEMLTTASFGIICRACLKSNEQNIELFNIADVHWREVWLRDLLFELFGSKEKLEKDLPQSMCGTCIERVHVVNHFLQLYHGSTKILLDVIKRAEVGQQDNTEINKSLKNYYNKKPEGNLNDSAFEYDSQSNEATENFKNENKISDAEDNFENETEDIDNEANINFFSEDHDKNEDVNNEWNEDVNNEWSAETNEISQLEDSVMDHKDNNIDIESSPVEEIITISFKDITEECFEVKGVEENNKEDVGNLETDNIRQLLEEDDVFEEKFDTDEKSEACSDDIEAETVKEDDDSEAKTLKEDDDFDQEFGMDEKNEAVNDDSKKNDNLDEFQEDENGECLKALKNRISKQLIEKNTDYLSTEILRYMCANCDEAFDSYQQLEIHKNHKNHRHKQIFVCPSPECELRFESHSKFLEHFRSHFEERNFSCAICRKRFKTESHASAHIREQHVNPPTHKCDFCSKVFKRFSHLKLHQKTHTGEKIHCEQCGKMLSSYSLYMHLQRHKVKAGLLDPSRIVPKKPDQDFECHLCSLKLSSKHCLEMHVKRHGPKNYKCRECRAAYSTDNLLQDHIKKLHTDGDYLCSVCGENIKQKYLLDQHLKSEHINEQILFDCEICNKKFINSISYREHMRVHKGETKYCCKQCDKYFPSESKLSRHMRSHTGEKPYTCAHCEKRFSGKEYLQLHIETHRRKKAVAEPQAETNEDGMQNLTFKCPYCENEFKGEKAMLLHMNEDHGDILSEVTVVEMVD